jgi:hypothetical protein
MAADVLKSFLAAHKLKEGDLLDSKVKGDTVTAVTKGGQKIVWTDGDKPAEIPAHQAPGAKPPERKKKS